MNPLIIDQESGGNIRSGHLKRTNKCLFPEKLYNILSNSAYNEYLWWNEKGNGFYLDRSRIGESGILSQFFKTDKRESFERQLRGYHFKLLIDNRKSKDKGKNIVDYSHPHFQRDYPQLLKMIRNNGNHKKTQMRQQAKINRAHQVSTGRLPQSTTGIIPSPTTLPSLVPGHSTMMHSATSGMHSNSLSYESHASLGNHFLPSPPFTPPHLETPTEQSPMVFSIPLPTASVSGYFPNTMAFSAPQTSPFMSTHDMYFVNNHVAMPPTHPNFPSMLNVYNV
ncbi:stress-responsive transcription factor hsf1 [Dispira simplex]|nr:stress-responsive transcription factor hsf1 [Dispira simplex]